MQPSHRANNHQDSIAGTRLSAGICRQHPLHYERFEEKLEQLRAIFQQLRLNANTVLLARAAWNYSGYWISQSRNPFATRNAYGV
jgi:hypothetical protein